MKNILCASGIPIRTAIGAKNGGRFDENQRICLPEGTGGGISGAGGRLLGGRTTCFKDPIHEGLSGLSYIYPCLMSHEPVDLLDCDAGNQRYQGEVRFFRRMHCPGINAFWQKAVATVDCWRTESRIFLW